MAEVEAIKEHDSIKLISHLLEIRCSKQMSDIWNIGLNLALRISVQKYSVLNPEGQDFRQLKYVADRLKTPFVDCEISKTQKRFSRSLFINIKETDDCPCYSEKKFKNCCWNKEHLIIPHTLIDFKDKLPTHLQNELFTY